MFNYGDIVWICPDGVVLEALVTDVTEEDISHLSCITRETYSVSYRVEHGHPEQEHYLRSYASVLQEEKMNSIKLHTVVFSHKYTALVALRQVHETAMNDIETELGYIVCA